MNKNVFIENVRLKLCQKGAAKVLSTGTSHRNTESKMRETITFSGSNSRSLRDPRMLRDQSKSIAKQKLIA